MHPAMTYDRYFFISCLMGEDLYKTDRADNVRPNFKTLEERWQQLVGQQVSDFYLSEYTALFRRPDAPELQQWP